MRTAVPRQSARGEAPLPKGRAPAFSGPASPLWSLLARAGGRPLQAKLRVGAVDDPLEREADRVAEAVVSGSAAPATVQRKCAACEEEEKEAAVHRSPAELPTEDEEEKLQTKRAAGPTGSTPEVSPKTASRIASFRGGGEALPPAAKAYFEPHFGRDLSAVRLHTGAEATAAAGEVAARAFTVGRDIAFAANEYRPETEPGRRLLAHEIVHTLQQSTGSGPGPLRRQPATTPPPTPTPLPVTMPTPGSTDFLIERIGTSTTARIFFGRGSATLSAAALTKLDEVKAASPGSVRLVGYASADETATIATSRADAVKTVLAAAPNPVTVASAVGNAPATSTRSDYTEARSVEILVGSAAPATLDCKKKVGGVLVNPPTQACTAMDPLTWTSFGLAHTVANDAMKKAVAAVTGTPSADDEKLIDRFFGAHDAATLSTLVTNLGKLEKQVNKLPSITNCGGQCDVGNCAKGTTIAYTNGEVDAKLRMTLCVPTFKNLNQNDEARNLIHESAHGTSPLGGTPTKGTTDVAYRHERMLFQLSTADRLRNSDSYALFAMFLREAKVTGKAGAEPSGISKPASDTLSGFVPANPTEKPALKLALAKLEKRLTWAVTRVGQLFGEVVDVRAGKQTWAASWAEELMKQAAARFPLTMPSTTKPPLTDQHRVAALLDRYERMKRAVKRNLTVTRVATGVASWTAASWVAGASLKVGPDFFTATPGDQISLLLESLAKATRNVDPAFIPAYVSLAKWIHDQNP
jgi:outer membrane protein OmpA-like peptidoglycan-associated protein